MKLRNKKTGEIGKPTFISVDYQIVVLPDDKSKTASYYSSLAELNKDWEDYKEPKEYWYIDCYGEVLHAFYNGNEWDERRKEIGNYFETKEEAEKAVEKLKAWTRLKDHVLRLTLNKFQRHIKYDFKAGGINSAYNPEDALKDVDICFGGEE